MCILPYNEGTLIGCKIRIEYLTSRLAKVNRSFKTPLLKKAPAPGDRATASDRPVACALLLPGLMHTNEQAPAQVRPFAAATGSTTATTGAPEAAMAQLSSSAAATANIDPFRVASLFSHYADSTSPSRSTQPLASQTPLVNCGSVVEAPGPKSHAGGSSAALRGSGPDESQNCMTGPGPGSGRQPKASAGMELLSGEPDSAEDGPQDHASDAREPAGNERASADALGLEKSFPEQDHGETKPGDDGKTRPKARHRRHKSKPHQGKAPHLTNKTQLPAPDGGGDDRKEVGVGERVDITASADGGKWKVEGGTKFKEHGNHLTWEAPPTARNCTISYELGGETVSLVLTVIAPLEIAMRKIDEMSYAAGTQGVGMHIEFRLTPLNVCFGRTQLLEIPGPATNITGYYASFPASGLAHHPNPSFIDINNDNRMNGQDTAAQSGYPAPWTAGSFDWVIPNRYKVDGEAGSGYHFVDTIQSRQIEGPPQEGRTTMTKGGHPSVSAVRSP